MDIKDSSKKLIVNEINYVTQQMEQVDDPVKQLYYFSAIYAMILRIMNIDYTQELVFTHFVLQSTHQAFNTRLNAFHKVGDHSIVINEEQFIKLIGLSKELARQIKSNKDINNTLRKFIVLAYSTTGNGYYLLQKGLLKI